MYRLVVNISYEVLHPHPCVPTLFNNKFHCHFTKLIELKINCSELRFLLRSTPPLAENAGSAPEVLIPI